MRRALGGVVVLIALAAALAACGGAGDEGGGTGATSTARPPARTAPSAPSSGGLSARARAALVRIGDVPEGWTEEAGAITRLRCGRFEPFAGATEVVSSPRLSLEHEGVQERIAIYRSVAAAQRALRRLDSRRAVNCLRHELQRHVSDESGGPAGAAELMRKERLGRASHASRYVSTAIGNYGKVVGYIDAVHARVGRTVAALAMVAGPQPPNEPLYERVVALFRERLQAQLG